MEKHPEREKGSGLMGEIIFMPRPKTLTPEQREAWHQEAAYWEEIGRRALLDYEMAQRRREDALRMLGMLGVEKGLEEES